MLIIITFLITSTGFFFMEWMVSPTMEYVNDEMEDRIKNLRDEMLKGEDIVTIITNQTLGDKQVIRDRMESQTKEFGAIQQRLSSLETEVRGVTLDLARMKVMMNLSDQKKSQEQ